MKYDHIDECHYNRVAVRIDNKIGFIDNNGKIVIPLEYTTVYRYLKIGLYEEFCEKKLTVKVYNENKYNPNNNIIYEYIVPICLCCYDNLVYCFDINGKLLFKSEYNDIKDDCVKLLIKFLINQIRINKLNHLCIN